MNDALISDCGKYRYMLRRDTGLLMPEISSVLFVMLNPSIADATQDDPTIRRCIGFAKTWDASGLVVANLYAYRTTNPKELWDTADPIGISNNFRLGSLLAEFDDVVCAWGRNAKRERVRNFMGMARHHGCRTRCLGINKDGSPKHPLYVRADQKLIYYKV